ncbi:hypothetical protein [Roseovarius sp. D22-M7]|uniref:hypothetical protein n=1 Tax=Roseovarius sp. D22-M7 TaxID=3127116 RepID=UPI00300FDF64
MLDTTGLPPTPPNLGQPVAASIFDWADPMPTWAPASYTPGNGFSDMYRAFLGALKPSPPVKAAIARSTQYRMPDQATGPYAGYTIAPSLSAWYVAALQAETGGKAPQLDFTIRSAAGPMAAAVLPQAALAQARVTPVTAAAAPTRMTGHPRPPGSGGVEMPFLCIDPPTPGPAIARRLAPSPGGPGPQTPSVSAARMSIRYEAQSLSKFFIHPGGWYDSSMLAIYDDQIMPSSPLAKKDLFGEKGLLNLTTNALVVAYKRSVTLNGPSSEIAKFKSALQGGSTVSAGGFAFHPGTDSVASSNSDTTLRLADNTNTPHVIGIGIQIMG